MHCEKPGADAASAAKMYQLMLSRNNHLFMIYN